MKKKNEIVRKWAAAAMAAIMCIALTACGTQGEQEETEQSQSAAPVETEQEPVETSEAVQEEKEDMQQQTVFEQYETALEEKGESFERVQMAAEIVGAREGVKYKIGNGAVELYLFDEENEAYQRAYENQALTMEGFGDFPATVENGMAIIVSDLEEERYIEIFQSLKVAE